MPNLSLEQWGLGAVIAVIIIKEVFAMLKFLITALLKKINPSTNDRRSGYNDALQEQTVTALREIMRAMEEMCSLLTKHIDHMDDFRTDVREYIKEHRNGFPN